MTENEAIEELKTSIALAKMCTQNSERKKEIEAYNMAIKALEEIQSYRAIGLTPELIEAMQGHNVALINDLGEYQLIGTVEEFKALKEKEHNYDNCHNYTCRKKCEKDGYARAIDEFAEEAMKQFTDFDLKHGYPTVTDCKVILRDVAEQLKGGAV